MTRTSSAAWPLDTLLAPAAARRGLRGLEREALRVTPEGNIAQTPHPAALGSALTHPQITTDFSEALPEFVTSPHETTAETLSELAAITASAARHIGDELLWMTSMPCFLDDPDSIPVARYGTSNSGRMKHLYRVGLVHRYGRAMQSIAGVHFNYSFPEALWEPLLATRGEKSTRAARDVAWMGLIRNVQRHGWLLSYLFGASPAVCPSFTREPPRWLGPLAGGTLAARFATSLRLSDIGYKNRSQAALHVSTNSLDEYLADLSRALATDEPAYAAIGLRDGEDWRQLSTAVLQIENEYYGLVRPKRQPRRGERPSISLAREGVHYVEVRALDIDPTTALGITAETMDFLELFLWFALLAPSPPLSGGEHLEIDSNLRNVAIRGREPGLCLCHGNECVPLAAWAGEIVAAMEPIAEYLDRGLAEAPYAAALARARECIADPDATPSAHALADIEAEAGGFLGWALENARRHNATLRTLPLDPPTSQRFERAARDSISRQAELEATDNEPFETYLARYYDGIQRNVVPL
ncbi:MAG: glutamate--cysteine ligase [Gammaproteobacteria bacterium]